MTDRRFLVLFDKFPIEETQVRSGDNPHNVIVASRCVNIALFVSGDLRRNVSISIAWGETGDLQVITFPGESLKRVSPDERSISFFLLKASRELEKLPVGQLRVMDNGIQVKRTALDTLLKDWSPSSVFAALEGAKYSEPTASATAGGFVYGLGKHENPEIEPQPIALPRPSSPERFILDINLRLDRQ